jgi:aarF domain-containing kinase
MSRRQLVTRGALGAVGGGATIGATTVYFSNHESAAGLRRETLFWRTVGPVVFDYYWKTYSSSPWVKYQKWRDEEQPDRTEVLKELHVRHAPKIFQTLLDLKGLYVKLGQVLSVTALPIPEPYRALFRTLQSDVPGWEDFEKVVKPVLEKEFGKPLEEIFESVDPIPCGAASIGQAHRAKLKSGDEVIVKVQYPDATWKIPADIQCVGDFMQVCVWFGVLDETAAKLSFEEFARQFIAELDYDKERSNLDRVYQSSLDPTAPYRKRNVVIPQVYEELCTKKIITMTYLPGPKLEEEARRQLALLGIDTSNGIGSIIRDAAKGAADPNEEETGELVRRVTNRLDSGSKSPFSWRMTTSKLVGQVFGVDMILWGVRSVRRIVLWSQAATVASIGILPRSVLPTTLDSWIEDHRTAAAQAARLNLTEAWIDALFDVHGHQIFNLGLFNSDPHPGNILVVEEEDATPSTKLGLIDYGQCKELTPREQVLVARLILSVANGDSDQAVATTLRDMHIGTKNDSTAFLAKFGRLMFGPLLPEHLDHSWHRKLHEEDRILYFPKELSMVYRTSLLLRGLAISLQLNYSVGEQWKNHAQETVERHPQIVRELLEDKVIPSRTRDDIDVNEPNLVDTKARL